MTRRKDPRSARLPTPVAELPAFTPVPRRSQRHDGWTPERQRAFIEALADTGSVEAAARAVDMSSVGAYHLRRQPGAEQFRAAWEAALALGVQKIEDVAMDRALNGTQEPVYSYGKLIGTRIKHNDGLLMFILRNRAPERFAAGGGAKGLNAVGQMEVARLKKQWRKEWEAKQQRVTPAEIRASIDAKIEAIRRVMEPRRIKRWAAMSEETRAAFAHFISLRDRDLAAMNADDAARELMQVDYDTRGDRFEATGPLSPSLLRDRDNEANTKAALVVPQWKKPEEPPEPEPKTSWSLKDESFDP